MSIVGLLARLTPRENPPEALLDVEPFLDARPRELAGCADAVGIFFGCCLVALAVLFGRPELLVVALSAGVGAAMFVRGCVIAVANARRSRALGSAPEIISRAVLRMRIVPTTEGAAVFAADTDGRLGERFAEHVRRVQGTPRSGFGSFAAVWREPFPAFHRALLLVDAAASAPDEERDRTLDRAMDAILDGTRERATDAADSLRGPATAVYAFGVLLPLALVGVLPAAGAAGLEMTLPVVVLVYDLLLPFVLLCAAGWLLANRPVAFPPAEIETTQTFDSWRRPAVFGLVAAVCGWILAALLFPLWTRPIAAIGFGIGIALVGRYRRDVRHRKRATELDADLPDALYLVGRRVADGIAVERAIADAADELDGVAGEVWTAAARRQRQLHVDIETAFAGEYGALEGIPSQRAESAARLLGVAARAGPPAGRALIETADHLDELRRVERESRRELGQVTSTLSNTAAFFGPLVGGVTVAMADSVGTTEALGGAALPTAGLGLAVGVYILLLAGILTALSTGLEEGLDRATVGYRVGAALCTATTAYLVAFSVAASVAGGL